MANQDSRLSMQGKMGDLNRRLLFLLGALIVYCLVDLIRAPSVRYLPKPVWALIIVLVSAPLGALAYLVFGKDRHGHDITEPAAHVAARQ